MGLFDKLRGKAPEPAGPPVPPDLAGTTGWWLRGYGSVPVQDVDAAWAQNVRDTVERRPRAGHTTSGHAKAGRDGTVWLYAEDGRVIGHLSAADSAAYASAFTALAKTKRHGRVRLTVNPTSFKDGGVTFVHLVQPANYPCIPANQPPEGIAEAGFVDFEVKDEHKFKPTIEAISRGMNASPAFFVIGQADADGVVPVFAPLPGRSMTQCQVGVINKAGSKRAAEMTTSGPVWCPGMVWWRASTPQVELASWYG
jgi:hypothetical protein